LPFFLIVMINQSGSAVDVHKIVHDIVRIYYQKSEFKPLSGKTAANKVRQTSQVSRAGMKFRIFRVRVRDVDENVVES
jgi:hypothetical protein